MNPLPPEDRVPLDPQTARLRTLVRGAYDLQKLRIATALRVVGNFKSRLGIKPGQKEEDADLTDEAEKFLDTIRASYRLITTGIARNRLLPTPDAFRGDSIISEFTDLVLVHNYFQLESTEKAQFRRFEDVLQGFKVYRDYLANQTGVGPAMAGILISEINIRNTPKISNLWSLAGLDVAPDGRGRSWRPEHRIQRQYRAKDGTMKERDSVTYSPLLKTKLVGVLGTSFLRTHSPWADIYYNYRHRLESDPNRPKLNPLKNAKDAAFVRAEQAAGRNPYAGRWTPGRIHRASIRYMVKMFLADYWLHWRQFEGLPVTLPYHEAVLGHRHTGSGGPGPMPTGSAEAAE